MVYGEQMQLLHQIGVEKIYDEDHLWILYKSSYWFSDFGERRSTTYSSIGKNIFVAGK